MASLIGMWVLSVGITCCFATCLVPAPSTITISFRDFKNDGAMPYACFSAPRGNRILQLQVQHLVLPPQAALMVYADGQSHLYHTSCSNECHNESNILAATNNVNTTRNDTLLDSDVAKLVENLEKEIVDTEIFVASNEKIEERFKRSDGASQFGNSVQNNKSPKFEVNINREDLENMTYMKESKDNIGLTESANTISKSACPQCPSFKQHELIELYLRLPKPVKCEGDDPCSGMPELKVSAKLHCEAGVLAVVPRVTTADLSQGSCFLPKANLSNLSEENIFRGECLVATCSSESLTELPSDVSRISTRSVKLRHGVILRDVANILNADAGSLIPTVRKFEARLPAAGKNICFWHLDTRYHKFLELDVASDLQAFVVVYDGDLFTPVASLKYCNELGNGVSWLHVNSNDVFVTYNSPHHREDETLLKFKLHRIGCSTPPVVERGKSSWVPAIGSGARLGPTVTEYTCENGFYLKGSATLRCEGGVWQPPPQCVQSTALSDSPGRQSSIEAEEMTAAVNATLVTVQKQAFIVERTNSTLKDIPDVGDTPPNHEEEDDAYYDDNEELDGDDEEDEEEYVDEFNVTFPEGPLNIRPNATTAVFAGDVEVAKPSYVVATTGESVFASTAVSKTVVNATDHTETRKNGSVLITLPVGFDDMKRHLLETFEIDEDALLYFVVGGCALLLLLIIALIACVVVYRRRNRTRVGRKFDTFQNPIYEKTVVRVPVKQTVIEDDEDELDDTTKPALPKTSKAEFEDLSDSTVME